MSRSAMSLSVAMALMIAASCLVPAPAVAQCGTGVLRVDRIGGIDSPGCGSQDLPCQNIQYAINAAVHDDEILVAAGTHVFVPEISQCTVGNTAVACIVDKRLSIRGGYTSDNWSVSDPIANLTVIDGENNYRGILVEESANGSAELTLEGLTVTRCLARPRNGEINAFGGGLSAVAPDQQKLVVVIRDVVFSGNQAAGAETAAEYGGFAAGGAVSLRNTEAPSTLQDVVFNHNQALGGRGPDRGGLALGGAVYTYQSFVTGVDLIFDGNSALAGGSTGSGISGGLRADALGGAVAAMSASDVTLERILATNNTAAGGNAGTDAGGGYGGALYAEAPDDDHRVSLTVLDSTFVSNVSIGGSGGNGGIGNGGAIMNSKHVALRLDRTRLIKNTVYGGDGAISRGGCGGGAVKSTGGPAVGSSTAEFTNCVFAANAAVLGVGGGSKGGGGGGLFVQNLSSARVIHCTFAENSLSESPLTGLAITLAGGAAPVTIDIMHSILADHAEHAQAQAVFAAEGNIATFDTVLVAGNIAETGGLGQVVGLDSLVSVESAGFVAPGEPEFDYHLDSDSAAIDIANGSDTPVDVDSEPRDQAPDVGADEFMAPSNELFDDGFESGDTSRWSGAVSR